LGYYLLLLALLAEGGAMMTIQIVSGKLLAIYYGTALPVWVVTISLTMLCIALGYYIGGRIASSAGLRFVAAGLIFASLYLMILAFFSDEMLFITFSDNFLVSLITSSAMILLIPVLLFAIVGPVAAQLISKYGDSSGFSAGKTFLVSTFGGVVFIFLFGLYVIPFKGLEFSLLSLSILLAVSPVCLLIWTFARNRKKPF
jgi:hypothetical protein